MSATRKNDPEGAERAFAYAQKVFQKMIRHYKRKNADPVVFAALFVLHQQALAAYHVLAARAHRRWKEHQSAAPLKLALVLIAICYLPIAAFAQGVRYDDVALLDTGRPVQGATITVCGSGSSGTPCTPTTSIFNDAALSSLITQPGFQSGAQGNFFFYAACGKYDISITGNGITGRTKKDVQLGPCGTASAKMPGSNITLTGASNGNNVTLLDSQDAVGPLTGNATDQVIYTKTVSASTLAAAKGIKLTTSFIHGTGTASVTYKLFFGASACVNFASAGTGAGFMTGVVMNQPASTTAQRCSFLTAVPGGTLNVIAGNAPTENTGTNVVVKLTFNVAATDQVTGGQWVLELIQ